MSLVEPDRVAIRAVGAGDGPKYSWCVVGPAGLCSTSRRTLESITVRARSSSIQAGGPPPEFHAVLGSPSTANAGGCPGALLLAVAVTCTSRGIDICSAETPPFPGGPALLSCTPVPPVPPVPDLPPA